MNKYKLTIQTNGAYIHRPDGEIIPLGQATDELNVLLARAEKSEEDCDYWEDRAKATEDERDELLDRAESAEKLCDHWESRAKAAESDRVLLMQAERQLLRRAETAEAERDELKRKLSQGDAERRALVQVGGMRSEIEVVETISAAQAKASSIPVNTSVQPDWQRVRIDAAIAAMQGLLSDSENSGCTTISADAIWHADALIYKLKKEVAE